MIGRRRDDIDNQRFDIRSYTSCACERPVDERDTGHTRDIEHDRRESDVIR